MFTHRFCSIMTRFNYECSVETCKPVESMVRPRRRIPTVTENKFPCAAVKEKNCLGGQHEFYLLRQADESRAREKQQEISGPS